MDFPVLSFVYYLFFLTAVIFFTYRIIGHGRKNNSPFMTMMAYIGIGALCYFLSIIISLLFFRQPEIMQSFKIISQGTMVFILAVVSTFKSNIESKKKKELEVNFIFYLMLVMGSVAVVANAVLSGFPAVVNNFFIWNNYFPAAVIFAAVIFISFYSPITEFRRTARTTAHKTIKEKAKIIYIALVLLAAFGVINFFDAFIQFNLLLFLNFLFLIAFVAVFYAAVQARLIADEKKEI